MINEEHHATIKKNAFWLFLGQGIGRALRTVIIIISARILNVSSWGAFSYVLGIATFLTVFTDMGMNTLLTRETSRNPELRRDYLSTIFYTKLGLISIFAIALIAISYLIDNPAIKMLIPVAAAIVAFDSLRDLFAAVSRGLEKMHIEGQNSIFTNIMIVVFGSGFLILGGASAGNLLLGYAVGTGLGLIHIIIKLRAYIEGLLTHFKRSLARTILHSSWPFGIFGLLGTIMINSDLIMIGYFRSISEVGFYSAGQKITQLLYIIPALISTSFFPTFSRLARDSENFRKIFEHALTIIFLVAMPLTAGAVILAGPILNLFYGSAYDGGILSFMILASTIFIVFPSVLIANAIFAHDKQREFLWFAVSGVLGNIFFNFLFIPVWGIAGAALSTLINQIIINTYAWFKIKKITRFVILPHLPKILFSAFTMGLLSFGLNYFGINVWLNIAASGLAYLILLIALKEPALYKFLGYASQSK